MFTAREIKINGKCLVYRTLQTFLQLKKTPKSNRFATLQNKVENQIVKLTVIFDSFPFDAISIRIMLKS